MGMKPFYKSGENLRGSGYDYQQSRPPRDWQKQSQSPPQNSLDEAINKINSLHNMSELDPKDFADTEGIAARVAKEIRGMKTSQLRKFFDPLLKIEDELKKGGWSEQMEARLYMVIPTLAYAVGRDLAPKQFYKLIDVCIKKIITKEAVPNQKEKNFKRFMEFLRAIIAYNKYFFGGD